MRDARSAPDGVRGVPSPRRRGGRVRTRTITTTHITPLSTEENQMKTAYRVLATLIAIGVAAQVAFIAFGAFRTSADADDGVTIDGSYGNTGLDLHSIGGSVIGGLVLVLLIVSLFAKVPRGRLFALILVGMVVLQFLLAVVSYDAPVIGVLHGLNGLAIAAVAGVAGRMARVPRPEAAEEAAEV